ncbi:hypothetical protein [Anatilimnocola aggregata]|uniref:hypothetical protein n=1 Tax=Anatilimnocola aggregata TaxID=2528021 RepID=UPI0011A3659D|nr:hypothetical protein [Anatilimnocola aggregata]
MEWIDKDLEPSPDDRITTTASKSRIVHAAGYSPSGSEYGCHRTPAEEVREGGAFGDAPLGDFTGSDGLLKMLAMILNRKLPVEELVILIKRIHVTGFEKVSRTRRRE